MKKLLLLFTLFSAFAFGQFTVIDSKSQWHEIGKYSGSDIILYQNTDKTKAKIKFIEFQGFQRGREFYEFTFSTDAETIDKIYQIIKEHFDAKEKDRVALQFPEGVLYLDFGRNLGFYQFWFSLDWNTVLAEKNNIDKLSTIPMSISHVNKLFGK